MKKPVLILCILALFLPLLVIFAYDARYTSLQNEICAAKDKSIDLSYACTYPERTERERIVTTAFYRHIGGYFGRREGTSPSQLDLAAQAPGNFALRWKIGAFNLSFELSFILAVIVASVCGTLLVQKYLEKRRQTRASLLPGL